MTRRLLLIAAASLSVGALGVAPAAPLGGLAGVGSARAATSAAAPDGDAGLDDSAVGGLDQSSLGGPVDAAGATAPAGPVDASARPTTSAFVADSSSGAAGATPSAPTLSDAAAIRSSRLVMRVLRSGDERRHGTRGSRSRRSQLALGR